MAPVPISGYCPYCGSIDVRKKRRWMFWSKTYKCCKCKESWDEFLGGWPRPYFLETSYPSQWKKRNEKYGKRKIQNTTTVLTETSLQGLSNQEIKYLIQKAESYVNSNDYQQALKYYTQIIENTAPHPHYFKKRALINRVLGNLDKAIKDMDMAIRLDPDDANSYWERGACYAHKLSLSKNISENEKKQMLEKILKGYKASVHKNPTSSEAWLARIETNMLLHNWDQAISDYGECKPYIDTKEYRLIRSWLGCLALIFAGDQLEEKDKEPLYDKTIRLRKTHWCVSEIDSLFIELENVGFNKEKMNKAKEIHQKFIGHFDEPPLGFDQELNKG